MTQPTLQQIEQLGKDIYDETSRLNEEPEVRRSDDETSPKRERLESLRIAAAFNGIALSLARSRANV